MTSNELRSKLKELYSLGIETSLYANTDNKVAYNECVNDAETTIEEIINGIYDNRG